MISITQQIKSSLQNKRFVIFTIFFPVAFYLFFIKQLSSNATQDTGMIALFAAMFGIAGSGLNTFSQKVAKQKDYFRIMDKISPYSYAHYMCDSILAQTLLNILILFFVTLAGILFGNLTLTSAYLEIASLLIYFGLYYIIIGFFLGTILNDETLAAASMPIFFIFMMLNITPNIIPNMKIPEFVVTLQKLFPGYYYNEILAHQATGKFVQALLMITAYVLVTGLITVVINKIISINREQ